MTEIGLDSRRHGMHSQAQALDWQIRACFSAGCAGAFVFAWTDEWHRGGHEIEDWDFGLTDRARQPKPALQSVRRAFAEAPFSLDQTWPRISVVVCSYNGEQTIRDCLEGLRKVEYHDFEVIIVNDGSTDKTAAISQEYGFRVISIKNQGLSFARNVGMEAATGDIIAYTDDDAYPDPHWLTYLAQTFMSTTHAGVGGPNIAPPEDGQIAECVAHSPGGPVHVLLSDHEAEHIPGCNMAFRRECLKAIGGFDPQFRVAGDDVDVCWRLQKQGWTLGFSPAALVYHHRRNSVRAYWKQQKGYGKAEALLERKWPEKYNSVGHLTWSGRVYSASPILGWRRNLIYQGTWGSALFQSVYQPAPGTLWPLTLMPEWYLVIVTLAVFSALGILWTPLLVSVPLLIFAVSASLINAGMSTGRASFINPAQRLVTRVKLRFLTALLHLMQPLARLWGRLRHGLTPWRRHGLRSLSWPWPRTFTIWSETWLSLSDRLRSVEGALRSHHAVVRCGGDFDHWDLEIRSGMLGSARIRTTIEEHGGGKQFIKFRLWPKGSITGGTFILLLTTLSYLAALDGIWIVCATLGLMALIVAGRLAFECATSVARFLDALRALKAIENLSQTWEPILVDSLGANVKPAVAHARGNGQRKQTLIPINGKVRKLTTAEGSLLLKATGDRSASDDVKTKSAQA
jgi:GT2 family glycosyltransferase